MKPPKKAKDDTVIVRIHKDLREKARQVAKAEDRSVRAVLDRALMSALFPDKI